VHVPAHRRAVERVKTRGCAEFAALGYGEACRRASASLDALTALGFAPTGFVAPGWSLSPQAHQALATVGFRYTTTRRDVIDLATSVPTPIPAVCHRPGSMVSGAAARAVASWVQRRCRGGRAVRFALHPADVLDDRLDGATVRALDAIADSPLRAVTYQELVDAASTTELRVAS
jgi:predicted deacetylase